MSIAIFTAPLKGTPCTCIASGTNSINVRHVKGQKRFVEEGCGEE
jgi:hypothetical protein